MFIFRLSRWNVFVVILLWYTMKCHYVFSNLWHNYFLQPWHAVLANTQVYLSQMSMCDSDSGFSYLVHLGRWNINRIDWLYLCHIAQGGHASGLALAALCSFAGHVNFPGQCKSQ
jgi:hypothetical protein